MDISQKNTKRKVKQIEQLSPAGDLLKLTAIATFSFLLLLSIVFYIEFRSTFSRSSWFYTGIFTIFLVLPLVLVIFSCFLPWLESSGLNRFNKSNALRSVLASLILFVIAVISFYTLQHIPYISPEYWESDPLRIYRNRHRGISIGSLILNFLIPLIWLAIGYAQFWCSFTVVNKLRKFTPKPYSSKKSCLRAAQLTKWSFILTLVSAMTLMISYEYWVALSIEAVIFQKISKIFFAVFIYIVAFLVSVIITYAFTQGRLPIYMRRVQTQKLYLSFGLLSIFLFVLFMLLAALSGFLMATVQTLVQPHRSSYSLAGSVLILYCGLTLLMLRKIMMNNIQTGILRILVGLVILIPSIIIASSMSKFNLPFFYVFIFMFCVTVLFLFLLSYSIKWTLRIIYGPVTTAADEEQ